jgi:hypothetical protein
LSRFSIALGHDGAVGSAQFRDHRSPDWNAAAPGVIRDPRPPPPITSLSKREVD